MRKLLENARFGTVVHGLKEQLVGDVRPTLYLLQCAVAFVLLIGCVNVANLMLVRSNIRMKELAIRYSLGAGRGRLAGQLLIEAMALASIGGVFGVVTGMAGVRLLALIGTSDLPRGAGIQMDGAVLAFSAAVAVLTGLVFGSVPVYHLVRRDLNAVFRSTERTGTTEKRALWTRSALVVCQVSLAFRAADRQRAVDAELRAAAGGGPGLPGAECADGAILAAAVALQGRRAGAQFRGRTAGARARHSGSYKRRAPPMPCPSPTATMRARWRVEGYNPATGELPPVPRWSTIDAGYLAAMKIPLRAGRYFREGDTADSQKVVIVDEFLARKYWPAGKAVGGHIRRGIESKVRCLYGDRRGGQRQERGHGGPEPARRGVLELQTAAAAHDARGGEDGGERYAGGGGGARGAEASRPRVAAFRRARRCRSG